jgi:hypothetical protein
MKQWRRGPQEAGPESAGAVGGWAGHSPGGCGGASGRTRGRGGPQAAGGTPAQPGGSTLPVPATKNYYQYMFLSSELNVCLLIPNKSLQLAKVEIYVVYLFCKS